MNAPEILKYESSSSSGTFLNAMRAWMKRSLGIVKFGGCDSSGRRGGSRPCWPGCRQSADLEPWRHGSGGGVYAGGYACDGYHRGVNMIERKQDSEHSRY
jgi:hypothetical protein